MIKPLHFTIGVEAMDCYIYAGYLFMALQDGNLVYVPMSVILQRLCHRYGEYESLLRLAFSRNDYFSSAAGKLFLEIPEVYEALRKVWKKASEEMDFYLSWSDISYAARSIDTFNSPVLDMKMYAMNLYLGCENGLYESALNVEDDNYSINPSKLKKKFDAKVSGLNAGYGNVIVSSGREGLFNAPLDEGTRSIKVYERPNSPVSYRTGWSSSNILNYDGDDSFEYLENEIKKADKTIGYSKFDSKGSKEVITKIGSKKFGMDEMLKKRHIETPQILYTFNSSQASFFCTKDSIYVLNFKSDKDENRYLSSKMKYLFVGHKKKFQKPISASVVPAGCVIEFFDSVSLFHSSKEIVLEKEPTFRVRSFMNSLRYRNLVAATKMNSITIHSLEPFDTYDFKPERNTVIYNHESVENSGNIGHDNSDLPF